MTDVAWGALPPARQGALPPEFMGKMKERALRGLEAFIGEWRLEREIREASGGSGRFEGVARWVPEGAGALYVETGEGSPEAAMDSV